MSNPPTNRLISAVPYIMDQLAISKQLSVLPYHITQLTDSSLKHVPALAIPKAKCKLPRPLPYSSAERAESSLFQQATTLPYSSAKQVPSSVSKKATSVLYSSAKKAQSNVSKKATSLL